MKKNWVLSRKHPIRARLTARGWEPCFLATLFFFISVSLPLGFADKISDFPLREVLYDASDPDLSVAVMGHEVLAVGDVYRDTRVTGMEPNAVVLDSIATDDHIKCLVQENQAPDSDLHRLALNYFVYYQMKRIYEAQTAFWNKFGRTYAPDLETLVRQGFLKGFENGSKLGYNFRIDELSETKDYTMAPRGESFWALASPQETGGANAPYFAVNQRGEVRTGATAGEARWGPVWEYSEHAAAPLQQIVRQTE